MEKFNAEKIILTDLQRSEVIYSEGVSVCMSGPEKIVP